MHLIIKHNNLPIVALSGGKISELKDHIANGYPDLSDELAEGRITGEEVDAVPALSPYPVTGKRVDTLFFSPKPLLTYMFNVENRIRALEAKPAITINQFRAAVKTILGL